MISYLEGTVKSKGDKSILLLTAQGVGYEVFMTAAQLGNLQEEGQVEIFTTLVIKENAHELYGFASAEENAMFRLLNSISGVGPKSALAILNIASPLEIAQAVTSGDYSLLQKVSGIGRKTAERIVLELKNKVIAPVESEGKSKALASKDEEVVEALLRLGYKRKDVVGILSQIGNNLSVEEKLKEVLKRLATK